MRALGELRYSCFRQILDHIPTHYSLLDWMLVEEQTLSQSSLSVIKLVFSSLNLWLLHISTKHLFSIQSIMQFSCGNRCSVTHPGSHHRRMSWGRRMITITPQQPHNNIDSSFHDKLRAWFCIFFSAHSVFMVIVEFLKHCWRVMLHNHELAKPRTSHFML